MGYDSRRYLPVGRHQQTILHRGYGQHSGVHAIHPVCVFECIGIMGDHENRRAVVGLVSEQTHYDVGALLVEVAGRLVGDEQARLVHQRTGDGDAPHFTAGQLARVAVCQIGDTKLGEQHASSGGEQVRTARSRV